MTTDEEVGGFVESIKAIGNDQMDVFGDVDSRVFRCGSDQVLDGIEVLGLRFTVDFDDEMVENWTQKELLND